MKDFVLTLNSFGLGFFKLGNDYVTTIRVSALNVEELKYKLDDKVLAKLELEGSESFQERTDLLLNDLIDIPARSFEDYLDSFLLTADDDITLQEIVYDFDLEI